MLYGQLKKMKLICPVAGLDELGSIRSQYKVGFMKLVQAALATVDKVCENRKYKIGYLIEFEFLVYATMVD